MKWAIREAVDVYFKAKSVFKLGARTIRAGEPVLIFDTVKTSTLEVAAEVSYVTGGRGNARLLSYEEPLMPEPATRHCRNYIQMRKWMRLRIS